jgi:hypothetical protein
MMTRPKRWWSVIATVVMRCGIVRPGVGQNVTTGTLAGVVTDAQKGVLPGATVVAVHTPTNPTEEAVTAADGHVLMAAVRVGGPYAIKATMPGFKRGKRPTSWWRHLSSRGTDGRRGVTGLAASPTLAAGVRSRTGHEKRAGRSRRPAPFVSRLAAGPRPAGLAYFLVSGTGLGGFLSV